MHASVFIDKGYGFFCIDSSNYVNSRNACLGGTCKYSVAVQKYICIYILHADIYYINIVSENTFADQPEQFWCKHDFILSFPVNDYEIMII